MKIALLAAAAAFLLLPVQAKADSIILTATVDGVLVDTITSADGNLDVSAQSFGAFFNLNSLSIDSQSFLAAGDILSTNTLNINQTAGGTHQLVIDIKADGLTGTGTLTPLLSSFSVSGLTAGWNAQEQTFLNGGLLDDTGVFTATSDSAFVIATALLTNPFEAEARYTINSVGTGRFNGGVDISLAATPIPAALPLFASCLFGLGALLRRRRISVA